jgi:CRP-like cAMP-binding protein
MTFFQSIPPTDTSPCAPASSSKSAPLCARLIPPATAAPRSSAACRQTAAGEAKNRFETQLAEFGIPAKFVDEIIGHHTLVNYNKGSMIFLQGSPADLLFWVFTGLVKVYCPRSDGTRIMVKLAGPGDLIGHVDYIDSRGRRAQVSTSSGAVSRSIKCRLW